MDQEFFDYELREKREYEIGHLNTPEGLEEIKMGKKETPYIGDIRFFIAPNEFTHTRRVRNITDWIGSMGGILTGMLAVFGLPAAGLIAYV